MRLTMTQEGILNAEFVVGGPISIICGATFFPHPFSIKEMKDAVNTVVRINDAFRIRIDSKSKTQWIEAYAPREYEAINFPTWDEFDSFADNYAKTPLDLTGSLFDLKIFTVGNHTGLIYRLHHTICDAWCFSVLRWQLYEILEKKSTPVTYSFQTHCEKERAYLESKRFQRDRSYFLSQFEKNRSRLLLPNHHIGKHNTHDVTIEIPREIVEKVGVYTKREEVSPFALLMTAFSVCYSKMHSDAGCFYLGTTVVNRTTEEELHTIGPFINDIPLFVDLDYKGIIREAVSSVEETIMDAFRHQRFNYPMLQKEIQGQASNIQLYDVVFNYQSEFSVIDEYQVKWFQNGMQMEPLHIHIDHRNDASKLMITYSYITELFIDQDILALHQRFMNVLEWIIANDQTRLSSLSLMKEDELKMVMRLSYGEDLSCPDKSLYQLIEGQNEGIIIEGEQIYSLIDLKRDAEKVDAAVRGSKRVIGVLCDRSYIELAAIYGIIRGGNAYLPISPEYPKERIKLLLEQSGCDTVLVQRKYASLIDGGLVIEDILDGVEPDVIFPVASTADDTLYVIFTSGSTGTPKGAMVSNRAALNRIQWMCKKFFDHDTVVMLKTPYTFDVSVWEIFGFALGGFSLYILPAEDHYRQNRVVEHIRKGHVTDLHFVPTVFHHFLDALEKDGGSLPSLRNLFLSGEALTAALVNAAPAPVHNLYGPTECAVDVTWYDCIEQETDPVPIGKPIDNCQMYVLDKYLQPLPIGEVGQICIGGVPVGQGYINDPEKTTQVFVDNPFGESRLYLTGDLGYWREDGQLIYVGRNDQQVKINGQRIEFGEIEAALSSFTDSNAVVVKDNRLIAFYTGRKRTDLRERLGDYLPRHMVPHTFVHMDQLPITPSGKIDRRALQTQMIQLDETYTAPRTPEEETLVAVVSEALSLSSLSTTDNFYEIGGDSLSSIFVISMLEERGYELSISGFLQSDTIADAAGKMKRITTSEPSLPAEPAPIPPIIRAYLNESYTSSSTFAQSCVIPVDTTEQEIRLALDAVIAQHDALRAVFSDDDTFSLGDNSYSFRTACGEIVDDPVAFDLQNGPLIDVVLYPKTLKLTIHHFVVDAFSWKIIVDDLQTALRHEPLPPKAASYFEWARLCNSRTETCRRPDFMLPLMKADAAVEPEERYRFSVNVVSNTHILAALGRAANQIAGGKAGICVETHGRSDPRFYRTVGWFTSMHLCTIESMDDAREMLRRISIDGVNLTSGCLPENASILYNFVPMNEGALICSIPLFPGKINVNCFQRKTGIDIEIGVPTGRHTHGIAERLGTLLQRYLASSASSAERVEDIYALTPTQLGMFRNWDSYRLQYTVAFEIADPERLEKALINLAKRHPILKSEYTELPGGMVRVLIIGDRMPFLQYTDGQLFTRGDPDSLFRVAIKRNCIEINTHHIILDGWSLSILARDLMRFYEQPDIEVTSTAPFSSYVNWLTSQPSSLPYWERLLADCGVSSDLPHHGNAMGYPHKSVERAISNNGVADYARQKHVSVSTVLETAFSLLLLHYNPTAIFGKMVSGRNVPILGIREMVGPFVNMLPVYIKSKEGILQQLHEQSIMSNENGNTSLAELYANTGLRRINILFVVENYPRIDNVSLVTYQEENEFDLTVTVRENDDRLILRASYAAEKYNLDVIERALSSFENKLHQLMDGTACVADNKKPDERFEPPLNETESSICRLFEQVTGAAHVGRNDNYYDLGGTSLGMMELLCSKPLGNLTPSDFVTHPTPAALAAVLDKPEDTKIVIPLYEPENSASALILFSYGGGDAAAYTALVVEFKKRHAPVTLYFCPWTSDYDEAERELRKLTERYSVAFYSHCAGAVTALKLLDRLNTERRIVRHYIVGANIPPTEAHNIWLSASDEDILSVLHRAGMPGLPSEQEKAMIGHFRSDTEEYFSYFKHKADNTQIDVSLVLSRKDIFTPNYLQAKELWERYVAEVDQVYYLECATHYFQSAHASELAEHLLKQVSQDDNRND